MSGNFESKLGEDDFWGGASRLLQFHMEQIFPRKLRQSLGLCRDP